ncbi:hypothetical protein D3C72_1753180 [compost metagenome]
MYIDLLAQRYLRDRLTLLIGVIAGDFQPACQGFLWRSKVITGLRHRVPGRRITAVGKTDSGGISGKLPFGKQPLQLGYPLWCCIAAFTNLRNVQRTRVG